MLSSLALLASGALLYAAYLQSQQINLTKNLTKEVSQLTQLVTPSQTDSKPSRKVLPLPLRVRKRKAVHIDVENVRVSSMDKGVWVDYKQLFHHLSRQDGSVLDVTFYSTTHPQVEKFNSYMKKMGFRVVEQPVIFNKSGKASNTNIDPLMVDGLISESLPSKFGKVAIISGDGKFVESARSLVRRGQSVEFISFDSNASGEIDSLLEEYCHLVRYSSIQSIPDVIQPYRPHS